MTIVSVARERNSVVVATLLAALLAGCSGSSSASPRPVPTASGGPTLTTAVRAARGAEQIAFATLHAHVLIAELVRPGAGPLFPALAPAPPTCDPSGSATAASTTTDVAQQFYYTTFALYPAGDVACAQRPVGVGVFAYPNPNASAQPLVAQGYFVAWAPADDPYYTPDIPFELDQLTATVANAKDGQAQVSLAVVGSDAQVASSAIPARPGAGTFPNTFPLSIPKTLNGFQATIPFETSLAVQEQGNQLATTVVAQPAVLLPGTAFYQPSGDVSLAAGSGTLVGQNTIVAGAAGPSYAYSSVSPVPLIGFPPAAGSIAFAFQAQAPSISVLAGTANFPAAQQRDSGTFSYGGIGSGVDEKYVDAVNGVAVEITSGNARYALTITDLISGKPMTAPAVIPVDRFGNASPYTFVFDGTNGIVRAFTVVE